MTQEDTQLENWQDKHIIKLRDFKEPTILEDPDADELRNIVEPWLTALFQSEHLSLLTGAGISSAVHHLATGKAGAGMANMKITQYEDQINIKSKESAKKSGRGDANIEDEIRTINELIKGLEILLSTKPESKLNEKLLVIKDELEKGIIEFANTVLESERNIVTSEKD